MLDRQECRIGRNICKCTGAFRGAIPHESMISTGPL